MKDKQARSPNTVCLPLIDDNMHSTSSTDALIFSLYIQKIDYLEFIEVYLRSPTIFLDESILDR